MVTTSSTPTTLDRGGSTGTSTTNTTATTTTSSTSANTHATTNSAEPYHDDVFIDQASAAQYDSMLAEHIIRIRSQLHRDESSRASMTMSNNSAELFSSNEFDSSTISSNMTSRTPHMNSATSAAISCAAKNDPEVTEASSAPPQTDADTRMKQKERALRLSETPQQPPSEGTTIPQELNSSMNIINKNRVVPNIPFTAHGDSLLGGVAPPTTLRRNPHLEGVMMGSDGTTNSTRFTEDHPHDVMYDSQHGFDTSHHVNHVPIEAFSVPDIAPPVQAIQVSMENPDEDEENDTRNGNGISNNSNNDRNSVHPDVVKPHKKKTKKNPNRKKSIAAIVVLCIIASATVTAILVGSICGSGSVTCRNSSGSSSSNIFNNQTASKTDEDDVRANMIYSYINNITLDQDSVESGKLVPSIFNWSALKKEAMDWIVYDDPLQLNVTASQQDYFQLRQRYALAALWFHTSLNHTWINTMGWLSEDHECDWYGITCSEIDHGDDIGIQNTVIGLNMTANSMNGIIPADLAFLSNLRLLKFDFNAISGTIPDSLGLCTDLERVELEFNNPLTGMLPDTIMNWRNLTYFDISYNDFSGPLPTWMGDLSRMKFFSASSNQFDSTLPSSLGSWTLIENFDCNLNQLHGTLPEAIGNWTMIENFSIVGNDFTGSIPATVGNWNNLTQLALSNNHFNGTIPNVIGDLQYLAYGLFDFNGFTGSVPQGLCDNDMVSLVANCSVTCGCCTNCF